MPRKRADQVEPRQRAFAWVQPREILAGTRAPGADAQVVYEAPETSRIVASGIPRVPRVKRSRRATEPATRGLPFGLREEGERLTCWSCGHDAAEQELVRAGGRAMCPGCGAPLPFVD